MIVPVDVVWQGKCVECGITTVFPRADKPRQAQCAHCGDPILTSAIAMPPAASEMTRDNVHPTDAARVASGRSPYQQGRDDERTAIVAWLRRGLAEMHLEAECGEDYAYNDGVEGITAAIEAGEHLVPRRENPGRG
jgi:predicted  nucleic acid-binding Zn-ribbon protein